MSALVPGRKRVMAMLLCFMLIVFLLCIGYVIYDSSSASGWRLDDRDRVVDSYAGEGDAIYIIAGSYPYDMSNDGHQSLYAIAPDGSLKWEMKLSEIFMSGNESDNRYQAKIAAYNDDIVYLLLNDIYRPSVPGNKTLPFPMSNSYNALVAISSAGHILWDRTIDLPYPASYALFNEYVSVNASNDRVYLFYDCCEYVYDRSGNEVLKLDDISAPAAIGPDSRIIVNKVVQKAGYFDRTGAIIAYSSDGTEIWHTDLPEVPRPQSDGSMLRFYNDTLYVPLDNGIIAMDSNGRQKWSKLFPDTEVESDLIGIYGPVPFDSAGNVCLEKSNGVPGDSSVIYVVSPDGELVRTMEIGPGRFILASGGDIVYYTNDIPTDPAKAKIPGTAKSLEDISSVTVHAFDMSTGEDLWTFTALVNNLTGVTVSPENIDRIFLPEKAYQIKEMNTHNRDSGSGWYHVINDTPVTIQRSFTVDTIASDRFLYLYMYSFTYENPVVFDRSQVIYCSNLYVLDRNGRLLWQMPTGSYVYWMSANNSTVYYGTSDGRIAAAGAYVAGGVTLAAALYLFTRFFMAGAVARARDRLGKNANRNAIAKYVADNPGLTARDIARGLCVNLGTIRYHLLILSLNHKIVIYREGRKHVRYFRNSGSYSEDEQLVLSLMRREGMKKVLKLLADKHRLSNQELSRALDMRESAISRYMKELVAGGIVTREPAGGGIIAYSIREDRIGPIELAMKRFDH